MRLTQLAVFAGLLVACGESPSGPMEAVGTAEGPCEDFSRWSEIPSPFEGERCFLYAGRYQNQSGTVCKRTESVYLKVCADPKRRPDRPEPAVAPSP